MLEAAWRAFVGAFKRSLAQLADLGGVAGMDAFRSHHPDAGMMMLLVVPDEEGRAAGACVSERAKARRKAGLVFQSLELRLEVRVVIGDLRAAMRFGDTWIAQQRSHLLGAHAAAVATQGQCAGRVGLFPPNPLGLADIGPVGFASRFSSLFRRAELAHEQGGQRWSRRYSYNYRLADLRCIGVSAVTYGCNRLEAHSPRFSHSCHVDYNC